MRGAPWTLWKSKTLPHNSKETSKHHKNGQQSLFHPISMAQVSASVKISATKTSRDLFIIVSVSL